jgi:hypothetical protein
MGRAAIMASGFVITPTGTGSKPPPVGATGGEDPLSTGEMNINLAKTRMEVVEEKASLLCQTSSPLLPP